MARRNPNASSGIQSQQMAANTLNAQQQANQQFLQGFRNNQQMGMGIMGQGSGMMSAGGNMQSTGIQNQMGGLGAQVGLAQNIQQAQIANQDLANQRAAAQANYHANQASGLFSMTGGIGKGLGQITDWWNS